jgi:hypothetical protein
MRIDGKAAAKIKSILQIRKQSPAPIKLVLFSMHTSPLPLKSWIDCVFPNSTQSGMTRFSSPGGISPPADRYGTPLYVYDRATLDASVADYRSALRKCLLLHITYAESLSCSASLPDSNAGSFRGLHRRREITIAVAGE